MAQTEQHGILPKPVHDLFTSIRRAFRGFEVSRRVEENHDSIKAEAKWELTVHAEKDELDGGWIVWCEELPGCMSQGDTRDEALDNLIDAIGGVLEAKLRGQLDHADDADENESTQRVAL